MRREKKEYTKEGHEKVEKINNEKQAWNYVNTDVVKIYEIIRLISGKITLWKYQVKMKKVRNTPKSKNNRKGNRRKKGRN